MPDGLTLEAEHYYPLAEGSFPTILIRTPYGLSTDNPRLSTAITNFPVQRFVERGYHVVVQSVRGRFGSEGRWVPFVNEAGRWPRHPRVDRAAAVVQRLAGLVRQQLSRLRTVGRGCRCAAVSQGDGAIDHHLPLDFRVFSA